MVEGMNWLSTLGGAYSALADQDQSFVGGAVGGWCIMTLVLLPD